MKKIVQERGNKGFLWCLALLLLNNSIGVALSGIISFNMGLAIVFVPYFILFVGPGLFLIYNNFILGFSRHNKYIILRRCFINITNVTIYLFYSYL